MSRALNLPGYCLAIIRSGYHLALVQSDLVGYSVVGFGYNLVSCTLSGLSHESGSGTGIRPMTESWMQFMSRTLNTFGYCLAVMQSDLVGYLMDWFGYNLVSCTLSGLSHKS